ncbi:MAG: hypothetical protein Q614_SASC00353G0002 [Staphylococcus sp. DORA_6_22]|nr:MAG: hypothetical protein Q614_SASC00353G0002 [Staphylococcus sp. DORA_6_22]
MMFTLLIRRIYLKSRLKSLQLLLSNETIKINSLF